MWRFDAALEELEAERAVSKDMELAYREEGSQNACIAFLIRVHFKTLLETSWSPAIAYESQQVFPHFGVF